MVDVVDDDDDDDDDDGSCTCQLDFWEHSAKGIKLSDSKCQPIK